MLTEVRAVRRVYANGWLGPAADEVVLIDLGPDEGPRTTLRLAPDEARRLAERIHRAAVDPIGKNLWERP